MSTGAVIRDTRVLLRKATWRHYVELRDADENRNTRMTFDRGSLELMSPTSLHERIRIILSQCIFAWAFEKQLKIQSCGSTTFRREDLERGLEPDNCYYIQNRAAVENREELDLLVDPPPDLVLEVDIASSSINRMAIYAAMGVPEVWRWHEDALHLYRLAAAGEYAPIPMSAALPGFPVGLAVQFVARRPVPDEVTLFNEFRAACQ
ncbi:MAG: Uma2 family endonuclease [Planctomycetia bacterium]|nr:Uma2 family endonuclease [Planctomycetia bacterium]